MKSFASTRESLRHGADLNSSAVLSELSIYFNVSKIYEGSATYRFVSVFEIRCGTNYYLEIKQADDNVYGLTNTALQTDEIRAIINRLFDATAAAFKKRERERNEPSSRTKMPPVAVSANLLTDYLSSPNYQDLLKSCSE